MSFLIEYEGKVIVGADDSDPMRCPECRRFLTAIIGKVSKTAKMRCPYCNHNGEIKQFQVEFQQIAAARVLVTL